MGRSYLISVALVALAAPAVGQGPALPGPAGFAPPTQLSPEQEIPLDQAIDAARTALDACRAIKSAAVVGIVDLNGNYQVVLRADHAAGPLYNLMRRKAYTVLKEGMSSSDFGQLPRVVNRPRGQPIDGDPELVSFPGGLPIKRGGATIGVLSVSGNTGGADDVKCGLAGMAKFQF